MANCPVGNNGSCVRSNITNITKRDKLISKATCTKLLLCLTDHKGIMTMTIKLFSSEFLLVRFFRSTEFQGHPASKLSKKFFEGYFYAPKTV